MGDKVTEKIVLSIVKYMCTELQNRTLSADSCESLEVAVQCVESAYNIDRATAMAQNVPDLAELFSTSSDIWAEEQPEPVTEECKEKAEKLKVMGNALMKREKYTEAIEHYSSAIELNPQNAVYYCNRAAAHSKLNNHGTAIQDCKAAIKLDPTYSKAYGRLGIAYSSLNQHQDAKASYLTALQLEPDNESYKNNLQLTNEALEKESTGTSDVPNLAALDINALLNNPALMSMASQMLTNPNMQNLMSGLLSMNQGDSNVDMLYQAGQQLAQQMQSVNPEFVEILRRQMESEEPQPPEEDKPDADDKKSK